MGSHDETSQAQIVKTKWIFAYQLFYLKQSLIICRTIANGSDSHGSVRQQEQKPQLKEHQPGKSTRPARAPCACPNPNVNLVMAHQNGNTFSKGLAFVDASADPF